MLTVAIITCNRLEQLKQAVVSCEVHMGNVEWQLVVVDNHSEDETGAWLQSHFENQTEKLKYIYLDENSGVANARNMAYLQADGEFVYFLDDDARVEGPSDCLEQAFHYMKKHPNTAILGTEIYDHKQNGLLVEIPEKKKGLVTGARMRGFVGASHFVNKKLLGNVPLYPDFIFYGGEELYLAFRCYDRGWNCRYYREFTVHHEPSVNTRLPQREMQISRYTNAYRVRQALLPKQYQWVAKLFYYVNIIKAFRLDWTAIRECSKRIGTCTKGEPISPRTVKKLVRLFGVVKVFK